MELEFIPKRLSIIMRLKGLGFVEVQDKMKKLSGSKNRMNIERWATTLGKRDFKRAELLAKAIGVPIGYFYYKNVQIEMKDMKVSITIVDTEEVVNFNFL